MNQDDFNKHILLSVIALSRCTLALLPKDLPKDQYDKFTEGFDSFMQNIAAATQGDNKNGS